MAIQGADVVGSGQSKALVGLGHQVANVDLDGRRFDNGLHNAAHQQVRDQAREQRPRTDGDQVGMRDRFHCLGHRTDVWRDEK